MKIHSLCTLVPRPLPDEYSALLNDMREHGFDPRFPIVVYEGQILDGRTRWEAAQELGITDVPMIEWTSHNGETPRDFVARASRRRNLTPAQRATLAVELFPEIQKQAKATPTGNVPVCKTPVDRYQRQTTSIAAKRAGVSEKAVRVAAKATPQVLQAMREGTMSVAEAKRTLPPSKKPILTPSRRLDPKGQLISGEAANALDANDLFTSLIRKQQALCREIESLAETDIGHELAARMKGIRADADNICNAIKFATPFATCPYGPNCIEKSCKTCKNLGWVCKGVADTIPKEDWNIAK